MRKILSLLVAAAIVLIAPNPAAVASEVWPINKINQSTVKMVIQTEHGSGHCTAFSLNKKEATYMTAAHCAQGTLTIDGLPAVVLEKDDANDLLVVQALWPDVKGFVARKPVKFADKVRVGEVVAGYGYGLDLKRPALVTMVVADVAGDFGGALRMVFSGTGLIPGMSGGPIINLKGEVVSVNQCVGYPDGFYQAISCGANHDTMKALAKKYQ